jgi:hypothetical protein
VLVLVTDTQQEFVATPEIIFGLWDDTKMDGPIVLQEHNTYN